MVHINEAYIWWMDGNKVYFVKKGTLSTNVFCPVWKLNFWIYIAPVGSKMFCFLKRKTKTTDLTVYRHCIISVEPVWTSLFTFGGQHSQGYNITHVFQVIFSSRNMCIIIFGGESHMIIMILLPLLIYWRYFHKRLIIRFHI